MKSDNLQSLKHTISFANVSMKDVALVGGKNASLGELISAVRPQGVNIPDGFATTATAWWDFIYSNKLKEPLKNILNSLDRKSFSNIKSVSDEAKKLILDGKLGEELIEGVKEEYARLCEQYGQSCDVAVRSSATAEDLPTASFAGRHDSFLNIRGETGILHAILKCFASFYNERAIKYREEMHFGHDNIAISVGVQKMVRSDMACAGVCFTLEPESGFRDVIHIAGSWGLGENVVQGAVVPDEYLIFKKTFVAGFDAIISRKIGSKLKTMVYAEQTDHLMNITTVNVETAEDIRDELVLTTEEINQLAGWALIIENHYRQPMDIEWAKDGFTGELYN